MWERVKISNKAAMRRERYMSNESVDLFEWI